MPNPDDLAVLRKFVVGWRNAAQLESGYALGLHHAYGVVIREIDRLRRERKRKRAKK